MNGETSRTRTRTAIGGGRFFVWSTEIGGHIVFVEGLTWIKGFKRSTTLLGGSSHLVSG